MNDNFVDQATSVIKRAIDFLFVNNPKGTSMGVLFGLFAEMIIKILGLSGFSQIGTLYYILSGVFVFNLPSALRRHSLDPQIEATLYSITKARRSGSISRQQEREMYIRLYEKMLAQIDLKEAVKKKSRQTRVVQQVNVSDPIEGKAIPPPDGTSPSTAAAHSKSEPRTSV